MRVEEGKRKTKEEVKEEEVEETSREGVLRRMKERKNMKVHLQVEFG